MSSKDAAAADSVTSTSLPTLKKSALAQAAAKEWSEATSGLLGNKPFANISLDLGAKTTADSTNGKEASSVKVNAPSGFIFGSRLTERVSNADPDKPDDKPRDATSIFKQYAQTSSGGGGLFSSDPSVGSFLKPFGDASHKMTFDSRESSHAAEQHVDTVTGEEDEINLLHVPCKFFVFDRETKSWLERGMGNMRINEKKDLPNEYRIVGRATGNQRVCINSKIFPEMLIEKMSEKRLKISALSPDSDVPQLFVVSATPAAIANLHGQLEQLLAKIKTLAKRKRPLDPTLREKSDIPAKTTQKDENTESHDAESGDENSDQNDESKSAKEDDEDSE